MSRFFSLSVFAFSMFHRPLQYFLFINYIFLYDNDLLSKGNAAYLLPATVTRNYSQSINRLHETIVSLIICRVWSLRKWKAVVSLKQCAKLIATSCKEEWRGGGGEGLQRQCIWSMTWIRTFDIFNCKVVTQIDRSSWKFEEPSNEILRGLDIPVFLIWCEILYCGRIVREWTCGEVDGT